jgi:Fic family protein
MARVISLKKLKPNYTIPQAFELVEKGIQELWDFAAYYEIDKSLLRKEMARVATQRNATFVELLSQREFELDSSEAEQDEHEKEAEAVRREGIQEQYSQNLLEAMKYLGEGKDTVTVTGIKQLHKLLYTNTKFISIAGNFRKKDVSLFSFSEEEDNRLPDTESLQLYLEDACKLLQVDSLPALLRAALFYFTVHTIQPFSEGNDMVSMLVCQWVLDKEKQDPFNLMNLPGCLFLNKKFLDEIRPYVQGEGYEARLEMDLTDYLESWAKCYLSEIAGVRKLFIDKAKELLEYDTLTPRQKNSLNFWLEKAFFLNKDKLKELSTRQHEIMLLIAKYGCLAVKELVPVFQVDRKSIQDDFNLLHSLALVDLRGAGPSLKYYLDFRIDV